MQFLLKLIRRILSKEQRRFLKFCMVGASGVPVNLLCTWLGYRFIFAHARPEIRNAGAFLLGIIISIFTNFLLNDVWTWRDRDKVRGHVLGRLARFYLVCSLASIIQFGTAMALTLWLRFHYLISQLFGIALATAVNFVVNNAWTFRAKPQAAPPLEAEPPAAVPAVPPEVVPAKADPSGPSKT